ncbi:hypothetical protein HispidOSU_016290, partial [Sigmodon hispidus]
GCTSAANLEDTGLLPNGGVQKITGLRDRHPASCISEKAFHLWHGRMDPG